MNPHGEQHSAKAGIRAQTDIAELRVQAEHARLALAGLLARIDGSCPDELAPVLPETPDAFAQFLAEANAKLLVALLSCRENSDRAARAAEAALRRLHVDALTGAVSRSALNDALARALAHATLHQGRAAVVFVNLDRFKRVNDTAGHAIGDSVLQAAATALMTAVRETDLVARYGGDEFVILLPAINLPADAEAVADKVFASLSHATVPGFDADGIAASIGVAVFPDDAGDARALVACADRAMLRAKRLTETARIVRAATGPRIARADNPAQRTQGSDNLLQESNERLLMSALAMQDRCDSAEAALRAQSEGVATVVHELRNPLMPIRAATSLLRNADAAQQQRVQAILERQVTHLTRLVDDLTDVSRARMAKFHLVQRSVKLAEILHAAQEMCEPAISARHQALAVRMSEPGLLIHGDPVRLVQVFVNLLSNACKYTPEHGTIDIEARYKAGAIVVTVSDTGIGITATALAHIFDPFRQEQHATRFDGSGLGIGLAVVRELVEAHGGAVSAASDGVGRGSRFEVTLPRRPSRE